MMMYFNKNHKDMARETALGTLVLESIKAKEYHKKLILLKMIILF